MRVGILKLLATALTLSVMLASPSRAQLAPSTEQCETAWANVTANETPATLEQFIRFFGACPQADEARQRLVATTEPPATEEVLSRGYTSPRAPSFQAPSDNVVYIPAGRLLVRGAPMTPEGGGYGVILLRRNGPRNLAACEVFVRALGFTNERVDGWVEQIDGTYVYRRPIYWPTVRPISATRVSDCPAMLEAYDYDRAAIMLSRLNSDNAGPYLTIWRADGGAVGLFDYTRLTQADMTSQFDRSLYVLAQSENIWDPDFYDPPSLRERIRLSLPAGIIPAAYVVANFFTFAGQTARNVVSGNN